MEAFDADTLALWAPDACAADCSVKAAADRRRQEQMAKVKVDKKKKAARGTEVGGFEAHTKGALDPEPGQEEPAMQQQRSLRAHTHTTKGFQPWVRVSRAKCVLLGLLLCSGLLLYSARHAAKSC